MLSETPSIAFRNNIVDIELRPYYNYQQTRNSIQTDNRDIHSYGGSFNANYYTPFGLSIGSDITYSATSGYSAGYDNNQWLWNASLSYVGDNCTEGIRPAATKEKRVAQRDGKLH